VCAKLSWKSSLEVKRLVHVYCDEFLRAVGDVTKAKLRGQKYTDPSVGRVKDVNGNEYGLRSIVKEWSSTPMDWRS
jgi:hypothetical protein